MDIKSAYDRWASQYDTNENKTRDLEAVALSAMLKEFQFRHCLELGCGTGKNTEWLVRRSEKITAVDLSEEMLAHAKTKITDPKVNFVHADLLQPWDFIQEPVDLITFSLVLEHVEELEKIFRNASEVLEAGGLLYVGELHPYKQYLGTKARFESDHGTEVLTCYTHHLSDFTHAAEKSSLKIEHLMEFFDDEAKLMPRIISILFIKS